MERSVTVKLNKGMKYSYGWEITITGDDPEAILNEVKLIDHDLREEYPTPTE